MLPATSYREKNNVKSRFEVTFDPNFIQKFSQTSKEISLPVNPEIVKECTEDFLAATVSLPKKLKSKLINQGIFGENGTAFGFDSLQALDTEITHRNPNRPFWQKVGDTALSDKEIRILRETFDRSNFFRIVDYTFNGKSYIGIYNLRAAFSIINNNRSFFSEINSDLPSSENYNQLMNLLRAPLSDQKLGLLSGFPPESVIYYFAWDAIESKDPELWLGWIDLLKNQQRRGVQNSKQFLINKIDKSSNLNDIEKIVMKRAVSLDNRALQSGFLAMTEKDRIYSEQRKRMLVGVDYSTKDIIKSWLNSKN